MSAKEERKRDRPALPRLKSGVPRLDYILKGGFVIGSTYTIMGPPGSGKTIFANQTCFNHIGFSQGRCVYVTLLSETHGKMIRHLETLDFFNPDVVGENLIYISGYSELKEGGVAGLLKTLRKSIKQLRPSILVIDGIQAVQKSANSTTEYDDFLHELQAFTSMANCTTFLLAPHDYRRQNETESVVVDGIVELSYQLMGPRAVRELTVHKFRGTDYLLGRHEVEITRGGLQIHPRTEIQFDEPQGVANENRTRLKFGIRELDKMLDGGLTSGTTTTVLGSPGTGKTMLGLYFLVEGAMRGEKGIYFGFYEPPPRLIEKAERMGLPLRKYCKSGMIDLVWQPPLEHFMDSLAEQLLERVKPEDHNDSRRRLFIDGLEGFRSAAVYKERMPRFLSAFCNQLRMQNITTVISEELDLFSPNVEMPNPELGTVTEGVILLRYVELNSQIHRLISILKMRESKYDTAIREFSIADTGVTVSGNFASAEAVLSGQGELLSGRSKKHRKGPDKRNSK